MMFLSFILLFLCDDKVSTCSTISQAEGQVSVLSVFSDTVSTCSAILIEPRARFLSLEILVIILLVCSYGTKNSIYKQLHHNFDFSKIQVLAYTDGHA